MKISTLISVCRTLALPALGALAVLAVGGCGVTQPEENPWRDVSAFSWPVNKVLTYRTYDLDLSDTEDPSGFMKVTSKLSPDKDAEYNGHRFFELRDDTTNKVLHFLPMKDKLVTRRTGYPIDVSLAAPLEKGHSWTCGMNGTGTPWKATILERYSFRKIEGVVYENVIEVEYRPENLTSDDLRIITRFYAEGKGVVQTIESRISALPGPNDPPPVPKQKERTVLVDTQQAAKR